MKTSNRTEHRAYRRYPIRLDVVARRGEDTVALETTDLSAGGARLVGSAVDLLDPGDTLELALRFPGRPDPVRAPAHVRWSSGQSCGVEFAVAARALMAAFLASLVSLAPTPVSADQAIPTFDPTGAVDLDKYDGSERPDETQVLAAFEDSYESIDDCVARSRRGRNGRLPGDADVELLLNPSGGQALGVNARVSGPRSRDKSLVECLRQASGRAPYPAYDGPPLVVDVSFELDPGHDELEELEE